MGEITTANQDLAEQDMADLLAYYLANDEDGAEERLQATPKQRLKYPIEDFAGPSRSFPVITQQDVYNCAKLIGHADDPDTVKRNIIKIAKRKKFKLPDKWQEEEDGKKDDDGDRLTNPVLVRADGTHDPFTGNHKHPHKAGGSQGDDDLHSHDHDHDGDSDHNHSHADGGERDGAERSVEPTATNAPPHDSPPQEEQPLIRTQMPDHAHLYVPITRIDNDKWEVEGVATSEALDTYGTVFSYDASKKAFQEWINRTANVREMHQRVAVGKGIGVEFDDANKQIIVRSRVSKGARDTWTKVQEGVLTGYSVGAINPVWDKVDRDGKSYPYLTGYDLTELSLVDNPSNPDGLGLIVCRADGLTEVIETAEPEILPPPSLVSSPSIGTTRAGARISNATQSAMHDAQKHLLYGAMANAKNCGCESCQQFIQALDPDNDGDIDLAGYDDKDGDAASVMQQRAAQTSQLTMQQITERVSETLEKALAPIYSRQSQFLARLAQSQPSEPTSSDPSLVAQVEALQQSIERLIQQAKPNEFPTEVRAELSAVKELVERIAAQPVAQGPMMNGLPRPVDKRLATDPRPSSLSQQSVEQVLDMLKEKGVLSTLDQQVQAASLMVQPMRGRVGG